MLNVRVGLLKYSPLCRNIKFKDTVIEISVRTVSHMLYWNTVSIYSLTLLVFHQTLISKNYYLRRVYEIYEEYIFSYSITGKEIKVLIWSLYCYSYNLRNGF